MRKIVFFDIDGTLLDHDKKIPTDTIKAIQELKKNGHFVAIATGRAPFMFSDIREELLISSYISFNGQYVVVDNEPIVKNSLSKATLKKLHEHAKKSGHPLVFMNHETMKASEGNHPNIHESLGTLNFAHPEADPLFYNHHDIYQTLLFCGKGEEDEYVNRYEDFHFIRWHEVSTDVLPSGGSKAKGIHHFINELGFKRDDVVAFGDGLNDVEMLRFAGSGVAMGNATPEAKEAANYVTKAVDDGGIVHGLERLNLI
ncbi:Cof-type HAD-IIB family hydrolase [Bacillus salitolerans]|uniref:Cof-type HAD-IIB family hydrolase n=1 Tax=Bacillus salitolerans TaxID=1437434 RepID=A0ABW4LNK3_9BACI